MRCCRGRVLHHKDLEILTLLTNHARQLQPSIAGLVWHSVAPKSLQEELLNVLGLVGELLDGPLIDRVVVPAAIHPEAIEAGALWNRIGDLVQHLIDGLG